MFFSYFPLIDYNGRRSRNITVRTAIINDVLAKFDLYHPYIIEEWERPDTIAADYYGDSQYYWIVLICNQIEDLYSKWPLTTPQLIEHIRNKYNLTREQALSTVSYYKYNGIGGESQDIIARNTWKMPPETYNSLSPEERSGWTPVYIFDDEVEKNDHKRSIRLLDRQYLRQIERELGAIFN